MAHYPFNSVSASGAPLPDLPRHDFAERHGGWVLALCLHVMLFALLFLIQREHVRPASQSQTIIFHLQPAAQPEPDLQRVLAPAAQSDRAGDPDSDAREDTAPPEQFGSPLAPESQAPGLGLAPAAAEPSPSIPEPATPQTTLFAAEPEPAAPSSFDTDNLSPDQAAVLDQLRRRAEEMNAANQVQGSRGSAEIDQLLRLAQTDQIGMQTLHKAPQLREGVDREIDIKDVSLETAQQVLGKYGIKIMIMDLTKGPIPKIDDGYINRAVTNSGVMVRPQRLAREKYMAFTYGTVAEKQMAHLEEQALRARGFDPELCQVHRIVFGIVPTTDGFDLGVTYLNAVPLPGAAKQSTPPQP